MKTPSEPIVLTKVDELVSSLVNTKSKHKPEVESDLSLESLSSQMPDIDDQRRWQIYVMAKNYELSKSKDPDVRAKALERLAKTTLVGLYETKVSVNINTLPAEELQSKLEKLVNRINEKVLPGAK